MTECYEKICDLLGESIDTPKLRDTIDTFGEPTSIYDSPGYGVTVFNKHGIGLHLNKISDFYIAVDFWLEANRGPDSEMLPYSKGLPFGLFFDDSLMRIAKKICFSSDNSKSPWQPIGGSARLLGECKMLTNTELQCEL
jgi:hypothetical protein